MCSRIYFDKCPANATCALIDEFLCTAFLHQDSALIAFGTPYVVAIRIYLGCSTVHTVQSHLYLFWYYLWCHWWCYPWTLSSSTFDNFDIIISYAFIFGVPVTCLLLGFSCWYRWIKSNANSFSLYFILQVIYGKLFSLIKFLRQVAFTSMLCTTLISVYVGQATCLCRHH